jgi:DNA-binding transcriptional LysR family regulator
LAGVELRHFAALRAVAAERSFHGAARRLGYTQSAVSQQVKVDLMEAASDGVLIEALEEGAIDLAFVDLPLPDGPFGTVELLRDPFVLVVQADSPLAARKQPPRPEELGHLPLLAFRTGRCMPRILRSLADEGITPRIVLRSDHNETLQGLAAAGMGVALMPSLAVDFGDTRTAAVELGELLAPRLIGLAWHSERRHTPQVATSVDFTTKLHRDGSRPETLERGQTELTRA